MRVRRVSRFGRLIALLGLLLSVVPPTIAQASGPTSFANTGTITVPAVGTDGVATPYPSPINVSGLGGTITHLTLTVMGFGHGYPRDVDMLLVGPNGASLIPWSDVGDSAPVSNLTITLDDRATNAMPPLSGLTSGTFKPTSTSESAMAVDVFAPPAPAGPYTQAAPDGSATLDGTFGGTNPNGIWSLYVVDDAVGDTGSITGGWSLRITTTGPTAIVAVTGASPQFTPVGASFAVPLAVKVTDATGNPYPGAVVTFTAPTSGPSGSFAGGVTTATTNATGVATAPTFVANTITGSYQVAASTGGLTTSFSLTNVAVPQPQSKPGAVPSGAPPAPPGNRSGSASPGAAPPPPPGR